MALNLPTGGNQTTCLAVTACSPAATEGISYPSTTDHPLPFPKVTSRVTVTEDPALVPPSASFLSSATVQAGNPVRRSRVRQSSMVRAALSWDPLGVPRSLKSRLPQARPLSGSFVGEGGSAAPLLPSAYRTSQGHFLRLPSLLPSQRERPLISEEGPDLSHHRPQHDPRAYGSDATAASPPLAACPLAAGAQWGSVWDPVLPAA